MSYISNHMQALMLGAIFQLTCSVFTSISTAKTSQKIQIRLNICVVHLMDIVSVWKIDTVFIPISAALQLCTVCTKS